MYVFQTSVMSEKRTFGLLAKDLNQIIFEIKLKYVKNYINVIIFIFIKFIIEEHGCEDYKFNLIKDTPN